MATVSAPNGNTPQGRQVSSMSSLLNSITSAPQSAVQSASDVAQNAVGTLVGGQNQYTEGVQQQATQQMVDPLYGQQNNMQKAFSMYLADTQLAQKYANAAGGGTGSMNQYGNPTLMASAAGNQDYLAATNMADQATAGNLAVDAPNMGGLAPNQPFAQPTNPYLGDPNALVDNAANAPQSPGTTNQQLDSTLKGQNRIIDMMNDLITSEKGLAKEFTSRKSAEYKDKLNMLSYWAQVLSGELKDRNEMALRERELAAKYNTETVLDPSGNPIPKGAKAVAEVIKQGGSNLFGGITNPDQKIAIAEEILANGGVKEYRKIVPLDSILNKDQKKVETTATELLSAIEKSKEKFVGGDKLGGTGPLDQVLNTEWNPFRSEETKEMTRLAEKVRADYQKLISGVAISEPEAKRLATFLPNKGKNESTNYGDLEALASGIQANMELFELSVREGLTPNEAYKKYGKGVLQKYGVDAGSDKKGGGKAEYKIIEVK